MSADEMAPAELLASATPEEIAALKTYEAHATRNPVFASRIAAAHPRLYQLRAAGRALAEATPLASTTPATSDPTGAPEDARATYMRLRETNPVMAARFAAAHGLHD